MALVDAFHGPHYPVETCRKAKTHEPQKSKPGDGSVTSFVWVVFVSFYWVGEVCGWLGCVVRSREEAPQKSSSRQFAGSQARSRRISRVNLFPRESDRFASVFSSVPAPRCFEHLISRIRSMSKIIIIIPVILFLATVQWCSFS